jgi:outer membrane protein assembly factor BamB
VSTDQSATGTTAPPAAHRRPRRLIAEGATLLAALLGLALAGTPLPAAALTPDAWTAAGADGGNSLNDLGEVTITAVNAGRVSRSWTNTQSGSSPTAPAVAGGVAYHIVDRRNVGLPSTFTATSARSGRTLWTLSLPANADYFRGVTVTGQTAVVPFDGWQRAGGVLVVNLATRRIVWAENLPRSAVAWLDNTQAGTAYTDGTRIYLAGSSNAVNTYRLRDGALLWTHRITFHDNGTPVRVDGLAVAGNVLYTGGEAGLTAYDAASGRKLWTGAASGTPLVAGGRVYGYGNAGVEAFAATGCGKATCPPLWTASFADKHATGLALGGADSSTVFLTYYKDLYANPDPAQRRVGVVSRLSARTGQVQWSASIGLDALGLVRGGGTVWLFNEYVRTDGSVANRILGFSTTATRSAPLRVINLPDDDAGFPQSLAIASGTLFQQTWGYAHLIGYRVPGT